MVENYGYSKNQWNSLGELKKQVIRNWAWEEYVDQVGGKENAADNQILLRQNLKDGLSVDLYDNWFGTHFKYSSITRNLFSNTIAALNTEEYDQAQQQVNDRLAMENEKAGVRTESTLQKLRKNNNTSYSGCDITPSITIGDKTFVLGNISTISYSIHRPKIPVRTLGRTYPKSYVGGGRTIGGTLIFNVFESHVLHEVRKAIITESEADESIHSPLSDQIPPFDVTVLYQNEYGSRSYMRIYGLDISDESQIHSINDIMTENQMQYVARDIDLMVQEGDVWTPQALAASNTRIFSSDLSTPADRVQQNTQYFEKQYRKLEKEWAEKNNELYKVIKYIKVLKEDITRYKALGETDKQDEAEEKLIYYQFERKKLRNRMDDITQQIKILKEKANDAPEKIQDTEIISQSHEQRLGTNGGGYRDSPYSMSRQRF